MDFDRLDEVLQRFPAESFQAETVRHAPDGFGAGEHLARTREGRQPRREVGHLATRGEGPANATGPLEAGGANESHA